MCAILPDLCESLLRMNWSKINRYGHHLVSSLLIIMLSHVVISAQTDTISLEHARVNVEEARLSKQGDRLSDALEILAIRQLVDEELMESAVTSYVEAIETLKPYKDSARIYDLHISLALLHTSMEQYNLALNLLEEALEHYIGHGDSAMIGITENFIADTYLGAEEVQQAMPYVNSAGEKSHKSPLLTRLNSNTLTALLRNGQRIEGMDESDSTAVERSPSRTRFDPDYSGLTDLNAGYYQFQQERFALGDYYLRKAKTETSDGVIERDALSYLAELHRVTGDYALAYDYLLHYSSVNDSLLNFKRQRIINTLRINLEGFEKEKKISDLERDKSVASIMNQMQRITTGSLFIGSLIVLLGAYLAIRNYQKRLSTNQIILAQSEEINQRKITDLENNLKLETMHSMITGQEAERERVSKELHDSLGGLLSTVKLHFDSIQSHDESIRNQPEYKKAYALLDEACSEVRNIANNMQPDALLSMGLVPAVTDLVNRVQSEETPRIEFQHFDMNGVIEPTTAFNVYRIIQELISNSLKHAQASQILVQLNQKDEELMVTVEDDGVGFDPESVKRGMGTGNIESRVNFLKGEINVQSSAGEGTSTLITFPVKS